MIRGDAMTVHRALAGLQSTEWAVRNAAALELMDLGDPVAIEPLVCAIEHPSHRDARGSLIYALSAFRCEGRFVQLVGWACQGGYEAMMVSMSIIEEQALVAAPNERPRVAELLAELRRQALCGHAKAAERLRFLEQCAALTNSR
jgi:hypothetical protein